MNLRTVTEINSLSRGEFVRLIGPVFEHSPWVAEAAWPQRPFASRHAVGGGGAEFDPGPK